MGGRRRGRAAATPSGDAPRVAGHDVVGPVGFGANGAVWAAQDRSGRDVVVSVLALPAGEAGAARLRRLAALRHGTHPHLARIRQVLPLDVDRCAVVSDRVRGPTLATVVAARGGLDAGELAALLSGVGSALGHLHERGVVHGDVAPANVVVTEDGVPVLVDLAGYGAGELGTPGFVPPERRRGSPPGAPGDVWALARLVEWAAGEGAGPHLRRLLAPAREEEPGRRPAARDLASRAPGIAAATAIVTPSPAELAQARMRDDAPSTRRRPATRRRRSTAGAQPSPARPRPGSSAPSAKGAPTSSGAVPRHVRRHRVPTAWLGAAVSLGCAAVLTGAVLWVVPERGAASHGADRAAEGATAEYAELLIGLLGRRDDALVAGDSGILAATTVPGGPAAREDAALLDLLQSTETVLDDLRTRVTAVEGVRPGAEGVVVDAVVVQDAHGRTVGDTRIAVPATDPRCTRFVVVPASGGTGRILSGRPCP